MRTSPLLFLVPLLGLSLASARAEVKPNPLFADNAVLQQGMEVPVWGTGRDGEAVSVEFAGQHVTTTARDNKWSVRLKPLTASEKPSDLVIRGDNLVTIKNVLVGEVWICGGQSNMERELGPRGGQPEIDNWRQEAAAANFPTIREFKVANFQSGTPVPEAKGQWTVCSPQTAPGFCAVGFFFARDLQAARHVPIGLLWSTWGGTQIEAWMSRGALDALPDFRNWLANYDKAVAVYPENLAYYQKEEPGLLAKWKAETEVINQQNKPNPPRPTDPAQVPAWQADVDFLKQTNRPLPRKPSSPGDPAKSNGSPSVLYNGMIAPLAPFALRGVCWYQGESNNGRGEPYRALFPAMIADWRKRWGAGDFPFLFVQLAPFNSMQPEMREAQLLTFKSTPRTAMVVTTDVGDATNIHPARKGPVGARLALAARALAYGERIEYSGPIFESMKVQTNRAILTFSHVGSGLVSKGGPLKGFVIAGPERRFVPAQAEIQGNTVVVTSSQVPNPAVVRYGWENSPDVNLFNQEGLPASPFRSDDNAIKR